MEGQALPVVISKLAFESFDQVHEYGTETFSYTAATVFMEELTLRIEDLLDSYLSHPECRYLITKSKIYRNLIHVSYLVIYRVTTVRVEVLNVLHSSRSITSIKSSRKIKIN